MELTGKQRIAVLLLAMGDQFTSDVFKRMDRQEIAEISKAIVDLEPVPREDVEEVLRDFHESLVEGVDMIAGGSIFSSACWSRILILKPPSTSWTRSVSKPGQRPSANWSR